VLIVVSLGSQRMFVFRDGALWDSTKVSTGKRGMETPVGTFWILQKKVDHRSNLYDDAPMPYMQRLTWGGVALHAGRVPNYPASHGCIRMPRAFAKKLYGITGFSSTAVVVTDERVSSAREALEVS
jgi:lipoprotein-anchoring transpeptidase ErfK/SrfK